MGGVRRHMKYGYSNLMRVGDVVSIGANGKGIVVVCIDSDEYSPQHPRDQLGYLGRGVMIDTGFGGLVHYPDQTSVDREHIELLSRKGS